MKSTKCKTLIDESESVMILPPILKLNQGGECSPDKARKDDRSKFEPTDVFEDMPQEWSAIFFYVAMPELEQTQPSRESDGRNEGTPDEKVDDQGDEWHDVCLPLKHQENHNDVVEKREDKLGISISLERDICWWRRACIPLQLEIHPANRLC
jgi:hypothetical protein